MKKKETELLFRLIERYLFHSKFDTENPYIKMFLDMILDMEIDELWMLTQM